MRERVFKEPLYKRIDRIITRWEPIAKCELKKKIKCAYWVLQKGGHPFGKHSSAMWEQW